MKFNLVGQLNEIRLPDSKALWPLFEAVVNSIQSLEVSCSSNKYILIQAIRDEYSQIDIEGKNDLPPFNSFIIQDNGEGFTENNYNSFLEVYSTYKISKGCKGIGRLLWLKAFQSAHISSTFLSENGMKHREFCFTSDDEPIDPINNLHDTDSTELLTEVILKNYKNPFKRKAPLSLEALAKKIIEHCLPYFVMGSIPTIQLKDSLGDTISLNELYESAIRYRLHFEEFKIDDNEFILYHLRIKEGANKHELHMCANSREVKSYDLGKVMPNLQGRFEDEDGTNYYYMGYLTGTYLDKQVNMNRTNFFFEDEENLLGSISVGSLLASCIKLVSSYLSIDLERIQLEKKTQIDKFVQYEKPQYRPLLNACPHVYRDIPANLDNERIELELHKAAQKWEHDIYEAGKTVNKTIVNISSLSEIEAEEFQSKVDDYMGSLTELSYSSLADYVIKRKVILELLSKSLEHQDNGKFAPESALHSIICPMHKSSSNAKYDSMNLWIIDERLAYHKFLSSDQKMSTIPFMETESSKRMDLAIFDQSITFSSDTDKINSVTIVEFKKPGRNDLNSDIDSPIRQVLEYVTLIKRGLAKKPNGRPISNAKDAAFYCYIIADLTDSLISAAMIANLSPTPDNQGYFGFNPQFGAYIEIISYEKLVRDARQRNQILFDKLFEPRLKS